MGQDITLSQNGYGECIDGPRAQVSRTRRLNKKTHFSLDYYLSIYEDFFSPPTIITPFVVNRVFDHNGNDINLSAGIDMDDKTVKKHIPKHDYNSAKSDKPKLSNC